MYDKTVIILADLQEFPHAQHYALCNNVLFSDIGRRFKRGDFAPARKDYSKVYIASKNAALISAFTKSHAEFELAVFDDVPDYSTQEPRKVASMLLSKSCIEPFDDLIVERERAAKQKALDKAVKAAEKDGRYLDPNPGVRLGSAIQLKRKGMLKDD